MHVDTDFCSRKFKQTSIYQDQSIQMYVSGPDICRRCEFLFYSSCYQLMTVLTLHSTPLLVGIASIYIIVHCSAKSILSKSYLS